MNVPSTGPDTVSGVVEIGDVQLLVVIAGRSPRLHLAEFPARLDTGLTLCQIAGERRSVSRPLVDLSTELLTCSRCHAALDELQDQKALTEGGVR